MDNPDYLDTQIEAIIEEFGLAAVAGALSRSRATQENVLTIVSNKGLHPIPDEFAFGELYFATEGAMKFENMLDVENKIEETMTNLKNKLLEKRWNKIYLIPFGHVVFNMHIKLTVFRTLWMDTVDIFYFGDNRYDTLVRDTRTSLVEN